MADVPHFRFSAAAPGTSISVLTLEGDVDILSAPELKQMLLRAIDEGSRQILVDLTRVKRLDSTGLGVLVNAARRFARGSLTIVCRDISLRPVFELECFRRLFTVYSTRSEALRAIAAQTGSSLGPAVAAHPAASLRQQRIR
jgi:anti-sigma B factor antagonist